MNNISIKSYMDFLGLAKISDIEQALINCYGTTKANEIISKWDAFSKKADSSETPGCQDELNEYLNSDYDLSMLVSSYTDACIIHDFGEWLSENKNSLPENPCTILDVGCGSGILSCFIALLFPNSLITAIDRSANCIKIANQIKEKLGIRNIDFKNISLDEFSEYINCDSHSVVSDGLCTHKYEPAKVLDDPAFDLVLSFRTFHENIGIRHTNNMYLPFSSQVEVFEKIYFDYCKKLSSLVRENTYLLCVERNHMDTEFLSILNNFSSLGLNLIPESLSSLYCDESDCSQKSLFQSFAFKRNKNSETTYAISAPKIDNSLFDLWKEKAFSLSTNLFEFTRPQIDWFIENNTDKIIGGYSVFDTNGIQLSTSILYTIKGDSANFLFHQANYTNAGLQLLPMEILEDVKSGFADRKIIDEAMGYVVKEES